MWNFPYSAIEEAIVNSVYHRSYEIREPIEVRITSDELTVVSFPGPDRSIKLADLQQGKAIARRYRNRRIGEFLKELDLAEGRCTGIPKMLRAMSANGSPPPVFESDAERSYFIVRLPANRDALNNALTLTSTPLSELELHILQMCEQSPKRAAEILAALGYKSRTGHFKKALTNLVDQEHAIEYTLPNAPRSRNQRYRITDRGRALLQAHKRSIQRVPRLRE